MEVGRWKMEDGRWKFKVKKFAKVAELEISARVAELVDAKDLKSFGESSP